jgi:hypothetical protein
MESAMSDAQVLALALSNVPTILAVLIGILVNNSRLSDLRNDVDRRLASVETKIDLLTGKVIEIDNRMTRVEAHLGIR